MVDWFSSWSRGIIGAVVIATLIEMIIPSNNSKKYIKILLGIFVVYTIISPIIEFFSGKTINDFVAFEDCIETSSNSVSDKNSISVKSDSIVRNVYIQGIQNDVRAKLKEKGYVADEINVNIANDDSYNIEFIKIKITEKVNIKEEKQVKSIVEGIRSVVVKIENKDNENKIIDDNDKRAIKQLLYSQYELNENKIEVD